MKQLFFVLILLLTGNCIIAQNVGIGTNTPLQKLHVQGNLFVSDSVGIGISTPRFPLSFAPVDGEKIALWTSVHTNSSYGFAVSPSVLHIHTDTGNADIAFGYGSIPFFNENVRIKGNGNMGIGTATPGNRLDVKGAMAIGFNYAGSVFAPANSLLVEGSIGIGTATPAYRLDVLHKGINGIRSRSDTLFSVVDIDAFNGDAALRFYKNGDGRWNMRNSPADDNLEFFELGGGGTRMVIEDSTGNIGIGLNDPDYRLDVLHFGNTGIRNKSSNGSSFMDIDAFNGDAALRFFRAAVSQWSVRNRSVDNFFEIFRTGGTFPGSRVVIKSDSTGNVGIGETINPSYKLDILHAGASGIRNRSSNSFSTIDIDGFSGDAALRFVKNGANQWNIRNDPNNDNLQFFEMGGGGERMRIENGTGIVRVIGTLAKGAGSFQIDHPLDPENKYLYHSFVESPDMKNIYDGNIVTDAAGKAVVELPDYFEALNKDFRYQLTVIGAFAQAIISKKVENNRFEITTSAPNVEVSWMVTGIRQDAYANKNRIPNSVNKEPENKGRYLHPAAFNQPVTKGIGYPTEAGSATPSPLATQQTAAPKVEDGIPGLPPAPKQKNNKPTVKSSTD